MLPPRPPCVGRNGPERETRHQAFALVRLAFAAMTVRRPIHVIGGGLAGSEAAWQIAATGVPVVLHEMRPLRSTEAHKTDAFAELVCSNSFRSDDWENNAVGLLHEEMRRAGSLILAAGDTHKLPAGGALAVDRDAFSAEVTARLSSTRSLPSNAASSTACHPMTGRTPSSPRAR